MNIVDYVIIGIIAVSVIFGLYRGFISTVLNAGGGLISMGLSFWLSPKLAALVQGNTTLQDMLGSYTDLSSRLGDLDLALTKVQDLAYAGASKIEEIITRTNLPEPFATLLRSNLTNMAYAGQEGVVTVQDYISQTILNACISVISFVICFILCFLVISILVNLLRAIFRFPVLKQLDGLAGGVFGLLRGVLFCYILMAVVPMVQTMMPAVVNEFISESTLAGFFTGDNLILAIMNGRL